MINYETAVSSCSVALSVEDEESDEDGDDDVMGELELQNDLPYLSSHGVK
jgi:hypothetical protein